MVAPSGGTPWLGIGRSHDANGSGAVLDGERPEETWRVDTNRAGRGRPHHGPIESKLPAIAGGRDHDLVGQVEIGVDNLVAAASLAIKHKTNNFAPRATKQQVVIVASADRGSPRRPKRRSDLISGSLTFADGHGIKTESHGRGCGHESDNGNHGYQF